MAEPVVAYVIMCHHKREQVLRLARAIRRGSPSARVLIRHDQPPGFIDAGDAEGAGAELLVSDIGTRWGRWSLVAATLEAFAEARSRFDAAWYVLVSGQDHPVGDLAAWERDLLAGAADAVAPGEPLVTGPFGVRYDEGRDDVRTRYTHRWWWLPRLGVLPRLPARLRDVVSLVWFRYGFPLQAVVVLGRLPRQDGWVLGLRRRRVPFTPAMPAYKGEQWIALSRRALAAVLEGERAHAWQAYFATTRVADEAYFATVLHDAPGLVVRSQSITWQGWAEGMAPHPLTMTRDLLPEAVASGRPFARKFDEDAEPGVLDALDALLR